MVKKFSFLFVVLFSAALFAGCSVNNADENYTRDYPWGVVLVMKFNLADAALIPAGTITGLNEYMDGRAANLNMNTQIWADDKVMQIEMYFNDYESFLAFNKIAYNDETLNSAVTVEMKHGLLYDERTITFDNPLLTLGNKIELGKINTEVRARLGASVTGDAEYYYIFESTVRRSRVDNTYREAENQGTAYVYFFDENPAKVVIYDRFANYPVWYGGAVAATAAAMLIIYLHLKRKRSNLL
jgi:hypothetical protein